MKCKDEVKTGGSGDGETGRSERAARLIAPSPRLPISPSFPSSSRLHPCRHGWPKRLRYSVEVMNALTISAAR